MPGAATLGHHRLRTKGRAVVSRVTGVIQARTGSTRLPGKVVRPLLGRPVLEWVVRAATTVPGIDEVVVATTTEPADDEVVRVASDLGVRVVRGSVDDVLSRFLLALDDDAEVLVRLTADCPLLDPAVIQVVLQAFLALESCDHASTVLPRCLPRGMDAEVASVAALRRLDRRLTTAEERHHRTHVTSYLYTHPDEFEVLGVTFHPAADDLRVTLDTEEDLRVIQAVAGHLGDRPPGHREVVDLLREAPDLAALNAHVRQKTLEEM
jgi:spore coat polysaccharide biosynthesis protein SpsF